MSGRGFLAEQSSQWVSSRTSPKVENDKVTQRQLLAATCSYISTYSHTCAYTRTHMHKQNC